MRASRRDERGFVLIAAIWLLILCGAVAALLLARSLGHAAAAAGEAEELRTRLALDAAVETVAGDLLINGARSRFARAPMETSLTLGGRDYRVRVDSESGKLDLNEGRPETIDRVLAGLGWDSASRARLLRELAARRERRQPLRSFDEVRLAAGRAAPGARPTCLEEHFTIYSGLAEPDPAFASADLARLLGRPAAGGDAPTPAPMRPGTAIAVEASAPEGRTLNAVVRIGGTIDAPVAVAGWRQGRACPPPSR